jgi:hypothetical protein
VKGGRETPAPQPRIARAAPSRARTCALHHSFVGHWGARRACRGARVPLLYKVPSLTRTRGGNDGMHPCGLNLYGPPRDLPIGGKRREPPGGGLGAGAMALSLAACLEQAGGMATGVKVWHAWVRQRAFGERSRVTGYAVRHECQASGRGAPGRACHLLQGGRVICSREGVSFAPGRACHLLQRGHTLVWYLHQMNRNRDCCHSRCRVGGSKGGRDSPSPLPQTAFATPLL